MKQVFIIEGNTGEYSDRTNWLVKAFLDEEAAQNFARELTSKLEELGLDVGCCGDWEEREVKSKEMKKLDPWFQNDYTGSHYCLLNVELED